MIALKLTAAGRRLLRRDHGKLRATLELKVASGSRTLTKTSKLQIRPKR